MKTNVNVLQLRKNEERRIKAGHLWVYSNEVDTAKTPLNTFKAGDSAILLDSSGRPLGNVYVNPHTLICGRLYARNIETALDEVYLQRRLQGALNAREQFYAAPFYRWVYGESDLLPGLVIDRFDRICVVQIATAGMERVKAEIASAILALIPHAQIIWRNDVAMRETEGLPSYVESAEGLDEISLIENDTQFRVPATTGQKTAWFYDHRENRAMMQRFVKNKSVLDVFSYVGGWGVQALTAGAESVLCTDASQAALDCAMANAKLNNGADRFATERGDAFDVLTALRDEKRSFDVVVVDPPAFIKRKKDHQNGLNAYRRLNELAMRLVKPGGLLISASCSMHLQKQELVDVVRFAGRSCGRHVRVVWQGGQGFDHPVHPAIAETDYLKAVFCQLAD